MGGGEDLDDPCAQVINPAVDSRNARGILPALADDRQVGQVLDLVANVLLHDPPQVLGAGESDPLDASCSSMWSFASL